MEYDGVSFQGRICGVSIMRGESVVMILYPQVVQDIPGAGQSYHKFWAD
jgi:hypothetical protein